MGEERKASFTRSARSLGDASGASMMFCDDFNNSLGLVLTGNLTVQGQQIGFIMEKQTDERPSHRLKQLPVSE